MSRGDPARVKAWFRARGVGRPDDCDLYVDALYELAPILGINADVCVAQFIQEASRREPPHEPGHGVPWLYGCNPTGIGVTSDSAWRVYQFVTGRNGAIAHLMQLSIYVNGTDLPASWPYSIEYPYSHAPNPAPRWYTTIKASPSRIRCATVLSDLDGMWAYPGVGYGDSIANILARLESSGLFTGTPSIPSKEHPMATHRFILSAGHRNTNRGGAYREGDWTYPSVVALKREIEKRGGKAWIVSEEDGDRDPSFYLNGGLQQAAAKCVALAKLHGPFDAYISSHYDSSPGFHAIFPDAPTGGVDVKANNPLDVRLCRAMRDRVKATGTVPMKSWTRDSPGVMSERETGVGSKGYRLGEFYGTLGFRDRTARVIIEASGTGDPYLWKEGWVTNTYAPAIVDALEDVFGAFREAQPEPQPEPVPDPKPEYEAADPIPELATLPAYLKLPNGAQLIRVDHTVLALRDTPRLKWASPQSPSIGADVPGGELFDVQYLIINPDGSLYWYSPWATRFRFEDAVPYVGDLGGDDPDEIQKEAA
jgi:hypothetical protein